MKGRGIGKFVGEGEKSSRNFCPFSLSRCHALEVKEGCVEKEI